MAEGTAIASGLNAERPKRQKRLTDARVGVLVVARPHRRNRWG